MPFEQQIKKLAKFYSDNIDQDKALLDQQTNRIFNTSFEFNEEDFTHLYASLASNEKVCVPKSSTCQIEKENGHDRVKGLVTYFRILLEVAIRHSLNFSKISSEQLETIYSELDHTFKTIKLLQHRNSNTLEAHLERLMEIVLSLTPGQTLRYHAGFKGHTLYLNINCLTKGFLIVVNNLGGGYKQGHSYQALESDLQKVKVYGRGIRFSNGTGVENYLKGVIGAVNKEANLALPFLYPQYTKDQQDYDKASLLSEIAQVTGNCVIKNKLFAVRHTLNDENAYQDFYLSLLERTLNYHAYYTSPKELPSKKDFCNSVDQSQLSFLIQVTTRTCSKRVDDVEICHADEDETLDYSSLVFYILIGATLGGVIGHCVSDKGKKTTGTSLGMLIGALGGGIIGSQLAYNKVTKTVCEGLPESSKHCYSCK